MLDVEEQLARLRKRIAAIDRKYLASRPAAEPASRPRPHTGSRSFIEEWSEGEVVRNDFGEHFQTERLYAAHRQHGSADIGALAELPDALLDALGENEIPPVSATALGIS